MTIGSSPSFSAVNTELGRTSSFPFNMNDAQARLLAQVSATPGTSWGLSSLVGRGSLTGALTVGTSGGVYGYQNSGPAFGALSPAVVNGQTVVQLEGVTNDLTLTLTGTLADAFWYSLTLRTSTNGAPFITLLRSSRSSFGSSAGNTTWQFLAVAGLSWPSLNGGGYILNITY